MFISPFPLAKYDFVCFLVFVLVIVFVFVVVIVLLFVFDFFFLFIFVLVIVLVVVFELVVRYKDKNSMFRKFYVYLH